MTFSSVSRTLTGVVAIILLGVGIQTFAHEWATEPGPERMAALIAGCTYFGGSLGLLAAALPRVGRRSEQWRLSSQLDIPLALGGVALLVLLIWKFGMKQFGGFDHSALIDTGWRLASGQHPYSDFPCSVPVGFYLGAKYALLLFGRFWRAFVVMNAIFAAGTFVWSLWLLNKVLADRAMAFLLAITLQVVSTVMTSYWWYNPITEVSAILFFLSAWLLLEDAKERAVWFSYLAALALLATMKPNIAAPLIAGVTLVLFSSRKHRLLVTALSASALGLFLVVLIWQGVGLKEVIGSYLGVAGRGLTLIAHFGGFTVPERICTIALFALVLAPLVSLSLTWLTLRLGDRKPFLCVAGILAGLYGFLTNGEVKLVDTPLLLLSGLLLPIACFGSSGEALKLRDLCSRYGRFVIFLILATATGQAATRSRVWSIGPGSFFEFKSSKKIDLPFFVGLHGGPRLGRTVSEVSQVLGAHPGARVYFGPRMQWAYAAYGLPAPAGEPIWWHPGVSYNVVNEERYVIAWKQEQFDLAIFLKDDYTYLPATLITLLQTEYYPDDSHANLTVDLRKPPRN